MLPSEQAQDHIDEDDEIDLDVCHHGVGFDEDCEDCDFETAQEASLHRSATCAQPCRPAARVMH